MDWLQIITGTAVLLLAGGFAWMVKSVVKHTADIQAIQSNHDSDLKVWTLEKFVAREDYVQQTVLINSKLDSMGATVSRLDERLSRVREGV